MEQFFAAATSPERLTLHPELAEQANLMLTKDAGRSSGRMGWPSLTLVLGR